MKKCIATIRVIVSLMLLFSLLNLNQEMIVKAAPAVTGIKFTQSSYSVDLGEYKPLQVMTVLSDGSTGDDVTASSTLSDDRSTGIYTEIVGTSVKGIWPGTTKLTATYNGFTAKADVIVSTTLVPPKNLRFATVGIGETGIQFDDIVSATGSSRGYKIYVNGVQVYKGALSQSNCPNDFKCTIYYTLNPATKNPTQDVYVTAYEVRMSNSDIESAATNTLKLPIPVNAAVDKTFYQISVGETAQINWKGLQLSENSYVQADDPVLGNLGNKKPTYTPSADGDTFDDSIIKVDQNGLITGVKPGNATVLVSYPATYYKSTLVTVRVVGAPLQAPVLSAAAGDKQVQLSWNAVDGATSYWVYRVNETGQKSVDKQGNELDPSQSAQGVVVSNTTLTAVTDTGLINGKTYHYMAMAISNGVDPGVSKVAAATPQEGASAPSAPTELTATAGDKKATLYWKGVVGATSYKIYQGTEPGKYGNEAVATTPDGTTTSVEVTGLDNGTKYYFVVKAVNEDGSSENSNEASAIFLLPPELVATPVPEYGQISLEWNRVAGATSYEIYQQEPGGYVKIASTPELSFDVKDLTNGNTYYFVVKAVNAEGSSENSNSAGGTVTAATSPAVTAYSPVNHAANVPIDSDLTITFSRDVKAAVGKKIYIHKSSDDSVAYTLTANDITKVNVSGKKVTINPNMMVPDSAGYLAYNTQYYVQIDEGAFTDAAAGTPYAGINDKTVWSFTTGAAVLLDTPTDVKTSNVTTNSVTISWSPVKGAAKYIVYVDGKPTSPVTTPNAVLTGLTPPGSEHKFSVAAVSEDNVQSERSGEVSATLLSLGVPYLDSTEYQLNVGEKHQTVVSVVDSDSKVHDVTSMFTFTSSNPTAATVDSATGLVTAVGGGQTTVIQAVYTDASGNKTTLQAHVTVAGDLDHLVLDIPDYPIKGKTYDCIVTAVYVPPAKPEDVTGKATYESSDPSVVTVDQTGRIQIKGKGTATITVKYGGKTVSKTITVVDAPYDMTLAATPSSVVADGKSQVTLRATVKSAITGEAVKGFPVVFHFGNGTLADQTAATDEQGVAILTFTAPASHSTKPMTETIAATAKDPVSNITQSEKIDLSYTPAEIAGVVTDHEGKPVTNATVTVEGINGFVVTVKTGPDGKYRIPVTDGNVEYKVTIQTSLKVKDKTVAVTTTQNAKVGELNGTGQTFKPENRISGQLGVNHGNSNGTDPQDQTLEKMFGAGKVSAVVRPAGDDKTDIATVTLDNSGNFSVTNVPQGQYKVTFLIEAGDKTLVGPSVSVTLTDNAGQTGVVYSLIDPYGVVTDAAGKPVSGVSMNLYWADTQLNKDKGRTPHTWVDLPTLPNFEPNQNKNPQVTNAAGEYAWMVFPEGDYYIVAKKPGFDDYSTVSAKVNQPADAGSDSYIKDGIIHVGKDIVKLNFTMSQTSTSGGGSSGGTSSSTQSGGGDGTASNVPGGLAAGGATSTGATLSWNAVTGATSYNIYDNGKLIASGVKGTTYELTGLLAGSNHKFTVTSVVNGSESQPSKALEMTTAKESGHHEKYIEGYPDGTFGPERNVSREELAMILYRLYHLAGTAALNDIHYSDVTAADWSAQAIAAVTKAGFMDGYPDGSFLPKNQITREEMASVAARLKHLKGSEANAFPDTADSWARQAINAAAQAGIMKGYEDGGFRSKAKTTRAEVVTIMNRLTGRGPLVGVTNPTWSDVPQNHWAFGHVEEASRDHDYILGGNEEHLSTPNK